MFGTWPKNLCAGPFLLFLLAAWIGTIGIARAQTAATSEKDKDKVGEIKTLLKERRDTLQKVVGIYVEQYREGRTNFYTVAHAECEAFRAALEVDESPEARLAMLKQHLESAKAFLQYAEEGTKAGRGSQLDALNAKAIVLEAQIELLREELKAKQSK
jgi:outer membrane protein TolC